MLRLRVALSLLGLAVASARMMRRRADDSSEPLSALEAAALALEEEEEAESMTKWSIVVGMLSLAATFAGGVIFETRFPPGHCLHGRVPEAAIGVTVGCFVALCARIFGETLMLDAERFDFEFFKSL